MLVYVVLSTTPVTAAQPHQLYRRSSHNSAVPPPSHSRTAAQPATSRTAAPATPAAGRRPGHTQLYRRSSYASRTAAQPRLHVPPLQLPPAVPPPSHTSCTAAPATPAAPPLQPHSAVTLLQPHPAVPPSKPHQPYRRSSHTS
ncbi:lysine-rich arabinogalactan protein 19-like, partial [Homarus americanus]|uniref:lysine-rich arabinogalactan protein 19-like n=1 Tax=Homarus americanus TaxID=6706 RepID=UPI001C458AE3